MVEGKVQGVFDGLVHIMYVGACSRARCVENYTDLSARPCIRP